MDENVIRMMLVEDDLEVCRTYKKVLEGNAHMRLVAVTASEKNAYAYVQKYPVDAMIIDLELQEGDGLSLIFRLDEEFKRRKQKPLIFVVTNNCSQITWALARDHGVDFVIPKLQKNYSPLSVISKMEKAYAFYCPTTSDEEIDRVQDSDELMRRHIHNFLDNIGMDGTPYETSVMVEAIRETMDWEGNDFALLSKEVYPIVGRQFGVSRYSVEKSIRRALRRSWEHLDETVRNMLCPHANKNKKVKVTNTEFIANIAKYLKG